MLAKRDTRIEASRVRHLSPLQTVEDQSQTWGIRCHSCTRREGLPPSGKLSYKADTLRLAREPGLSFSQRIARNPLQHPAAALRLSVLVGAHASSVGAAASGLHPDL